MLPSGDPIGSGVCASNEDVREYVGKLCEDVYDQFGVAMIRLEGVAPSGYDYGWMRPRVLIDIPSLVGDLLSLCFCCACVARGTAAGLDVERLRLLVCDYIGHQVGSEAAAASTPDGPELLRDAEFQAFVVQHQRASLELAVAATSRLDGDVKPRLSSTAWTTYDQLLGTSRFEHFGELAQSVDQMMVGPRDAERLARISQHGPTRRGSVGLTTLLTPLRVGAAGAPVLPGRAQDRRDEAMEFLRAVAPLALDEVCIYNYGLLRDNDLGDLVDAVRTVLP